MLFAAMLKHKVTSVFRGLNICKGLTEANKRTQLVGFCKSPLSRKNSFDAYFWSYSIQRLHFYDKQIPVKNEICTDWIVSMLFCSVNFLSVK